MTQINQNLFNKICSKELLKVVDALEYKGFETRLVGGVVRDLLQNKIAKDIDLSTTAKPDEIKSVFENAKIRCIETGLQHGTLTAHINGLDFEVTSLRTDLLTDGRHAQVEFIKDWKLDAERRDLTINAMSMNVYTGELYDYFGGYMDLKNKKVKFVGDAKTRIKEDYLRIYRYFRFLGKISTTNDIEKLKDNDIILKIIEEESYNLQNISVERIWSELKKIIIGPNANSIVNLLYYTKVFKYSSNFLFLKLNLIDFEHINEKNILKFKQVSNNINKIISENKINKKNYFINIEPSMLLASFYNDLEQFEKYGNFLKLSNNEKSLIQFIILHRNNNDQNLKKYKNLLVLYYTTKGFEIIKNRVLQLILYESCFDNYIKILDWIIPIFPINGNQIKILGYHGKEIGFKLEKLKKIWIDSNFSLSESELFNKL